MRRTICFALFGLLVSSGAALPQAARPRGRVVVVRLAARPAVFLRHGIFCPFSYPVPYPVPYPVWNFIAPSPVTVFAGTISESPAVGVQGRHHVYGDGLLAHRRSA